MLLGQNIQTDTVSVQNEMYQELIQIIDSPSYNFKRKNKLKMFSYFKCKFIESFITKHPTIYKLDAYKLLWVVRWNLKVLDIVDQKSHVRSSYVGHSIHSIQFNHAILDIFPRFNLMYSMTIMNLNFRWLVGNLLHQSYTPEHWAQGYKFGFQSVIEKENHILDTCKVIASLLALHLLCPVPIPFVVITGQVSEQRCVLSNTIVGQISCFVSLIERCKI